MGLKTARLTVLIEPALKRAFALACRADELPPSQVLRHLIREYMERHVPPAPVPRPAARAKPR